MNRPSLLEYASCVEGLLLDATGYRIDDIAANLHPIAILILGAGYDQSQPAAETAAAIVDLMNAAHLAFLTATGEW